MGTINTNPVAPLVSVITPVYKGAEFITQAVESVLAQTYPNVESVVVDDGSPDNVSEVIQQAFGDNPRVRLILQDNAGTAAARNTGVRHANGPLIALLDQDDYWLANKLEQQVPVFGDPSVGMVHTGGQAYDHHTGTSTAVFRPRPEMSMNELIAHCNVSCASSMFRRSVWEQLGGFREDLRGTDDWMFWVETAKAGYRVVGLDEDLVRIRIHDANQGTQVSVASKGAWVAVIQEIESWGLSSPESMRAITRAWDRLKNTTYRQHCSKSRAAWRQRQYFHAIWLRLSATYNYPAAIGHILNRLMSSGRP